MADRPADMRNATLAGGGCGNSNHFRNAFYINNITGHTSWFPRKPQAEKRRRTKRRTTTHTDPTGTFDNCWHGRFGKLWLTFYIFFFAFFNFIAICKWPWKPIACTICDRDVQCSLPLLDANCPDKLFTSVSSQVYRSATSANTLSS